MPDNVATSTGDALPRARYVVDYRALQAPSKTSGFTIAPNANGTLRSVNASAEDQSGDAIKVAVKLGLAVATLTAGSPIIAVALATTPAAETTSSGRNASQLNGTVEALGRAHAPGRWPTSNTRSIC